MVKLDCSVCVYLVQCHQPPPRTYTETLSSAHNAYMHTNVRTQTRKHIVHFDVTTWCGQYVRAKRYLAFEPVTILRKYKVLQGWSVLDGEKLHNRFPPLTPWESNRDKYIPKPLISSCSVPPWCCTVPPCCSSVSHPRLGKIQSCIPESNTLLHRLLFQTSDCRSLALRDARGGPPRCLQAHKQTRTTNQSAQNQQRGKCWSK